MNVNTLHEGTDIILDMVKMPMSAGVFSTHNAIVCRWYFRPRNDGGKYAKAFFCKAYDCVGTDSTRNSIYLKRIYLESPMVQLPCCVPMCHALPRLVRQSIPLALACNILVAVLHAAGLQVHSLAFLTQSSPCPVHGKSIIALLCNCATRVLLIRAYK